jgi:SAM-dependent methyltransferase
MLKSVNPFKNGEDYGYLKDTPRWWFNPDNPLAFSLFDTNSIYPDEYYAVNHDIEMAVMFNYANLAFDVYNQLKGGEPSTILDAGCAGGWFVREFETRGKSVVGLDASASALKKCRANGIQSEILHVDLRRRLQLGKRFDMVCCSEVAEHIEPPFSAVLVENLVNHSDVVIWSHCRPGEHAQPHLHHPNEQPDAFWINLFAFYGYAVATIPEKFHEFTKHRIKLVFYKP